MSRLDREEQFADIPGFDNYQISSYGRVVNRLSGRELYGTKTVEGYRQVSLRQHGVPSTFIMHRLVAEAFMMDYDPGRAILHRNKKYDDNTIYNLTQEGAKRLGSQSMRSKDQYDAAA